MRHLHAKNPDILMLRNLGLLSLDRRQLQGDFPVPKGGYKTAGGAFFTRMCSVRMRKNGFILKEGWFRLDTLKKFFCSEGSETLQQVTQRSSRCHKPENIQGQVG